MRRRGPRGLAWLRKKAEGSGGAGPSQFLVEASLTAGLEVADDDAELPDVLHELLQVLLQRVELLRHRHNRRLSPPPPPPRPLPATCACAEGGAGEREGVWPRPLELWPRPLALKPRPPAARREGDAEAGEGRRRGGRGVICTCYPKTGGKRPREKKIRSVNPKLRESVFAGDVPGLSNAKNNERIYLFICLFVYLFLPRK